MQKDDQELEKYLSEFRPRGLRPLEIPRPATNAWIGRLAAAALLLFSVGGGLWYSFHDTKNRALVDEQKENRPGVNERTVRLDARLGTLSPNSILLTKLALENDSQFNAELEAQSRRVLPDFRGEQSTLRAFAKE